MILSFFDFSFLRTQFGNLKCAIGGEFIFLSICRFRYQLCSSTIMNIKENKMQRRKNFKKCNIWVNLFHALYNPNLNLQLDRNLNSPPIAHFRFPNCVLRKEKSKKEKWQCSQNLKLNPYCAEDVQWLETMLFKLAVFPYIHWVA